MANLPRLKGKTLTTLRRLLERQSLRAIARHQLGKSLGLHELAELPTAAYQGFEESPQPYAGRETHGWTDADYDPPRPTGHREPARALVEAYRAGDVTPRDVFDRLADQIERGEFGELVHNPLVTLDLERARAAADASTERYRDGEPLGPLDGVPVPIKDHHQMRGLVCGSGTDYMPEIEEPAEEDSEVVRRLREGGALLIGKSRTTEWGLQPTGFNTTQLMPRNPYDRDRAAGGSSTGTGAAVAFGLAPVGLGSDGGGSIRIPASVNGVFGLKPTYQRLSRTGDVWAGTMAHSGPLGQSTTDLVDFLTVAGAAPDPTDRATQWAPDWETYADRLRAALGRGVDGCRIGIWSWAFETADPAIAEPCQTALQALEREGAELVDVDPDYADHHEALGAIILGVETTGMIAEVRQYLGSRISDDIGLILAALSSMTGEQYTLANRVRAVLRQKLAETFTDVDLMAAPTTDGIAPAYPLDDDRTPVYDDAAIQRLCQFAFLANLCGLPAGSAPIGLVDGLPVGLQLIGDAWDEPSIVAAMAHLERLGLTGLPKPAEHVTFQI